MSDQPKRCRKCLSDFDLATGLNVSEKDGTLCVDCDGSAERTIKTHFAYPPIPIRNYDWVATFDSYEPGDLIGYGHTEETAIADLKEQAEAEKEVA